MGGSALGGVLGADMGMEMIMTMMRFELWIGSESAADVQTEG
jgi:hypothetical protein